MGNLENEVKIRNFYPPDDLYFSTTSCSVFETSYLEEVVQLVTLCNAQFINLANVYNHSNPGQLDYHSLEDGFFSYIIGKQKFPLFVQLFDKFLFSQVSANGTTNCFKK